MFNITQGPAKQTATDTINVFAGRLQSATLLEDRRNAVLGLRSFARQYPASVASGSLRGLIECLSKDGEDVDTTKVILETLLMLFTPDESSPEASEDIALWLADEFSQRQANITILLDLLEKPDFYSRLYSLQLLNAILAARPERTEECIFTAPLGISRLVAILDDSREAVRNEGLSLLTYLTPQSAELQKLVAFENAFDRVFAIIEQEGSLRLGGRVVEDCLLLLANLLRLNPSNQSLFRETGFVAKLKKLLDDALHVPEDGEELAQWAQVQMNRNTFALLALMRLFLTKGGAVTQANQQAFWQHGLGHSALQLAFSPAMETRIRCEALTTCGNIISGRPNLQEAFAQLHVPALTAPKALTNGHAGEAQATTYIIDALLDVMLSVSAEQPFNFRMAACECIKAYFHNHPGIRLHFLRRAIEGHISGQDDAANILTTLLTPLSISSTSDPYRFWLAAVVAFLLLFDDAEAKAIAMDVKEGDASAGEEVVTCIQALAANLIEAVQRKEDERVLAAYLMLLSGWLFEDPDAVNDLLGEGSTIQSLLQVVARPDRDMVLAQGMCALLLGVIYEFSTKDSPVSRKSIYDIISGKLGKDVYVDRLTAFRKDPHVRDFEVSTSSTAGLNGNLPEVYLDAAFVDFFKDNFTRFRRAIDREPEFEVSVKANGVEKGISRDLVDSLRAQLEEKQQHLEDAMQELEALKIQINEERSKWKKTSDATSQELARIQNVNDTLHRHHEEENRTLKGKHNEAIKHLEARIQSVTAAEEAAKKEHELAMKRNAQTTDDLKRSIASLEERLKQSVEKSKQEAKQQHAGFTAKLDEKSKMLAEKSQALEQTSGKLDQKSKELDGKSKELGNKSKELDEKSKELIETSKALDEKSKALDQMSEELSRISAELQAAKKEAEKSEKEKADAEERAKKAEWSLIDHEKQKIAVQSELDDLLMVFGDLEEKVEKYEARLKNLGESFSDAED